MIVLVKSAPLTVPMHPGLRPDNWPDRRTLRHSRLLTGVLVPTVGTGIASGTHVDTSTVEMTDGAPVRNELTVGTSVSRPTNVRPASCLLLKANC